MKYDIILAGVGGQGVLSVAAVIATAAMEAGLEVRQSEVHGMAQRGGAVMSHLRMADGPIYSDLVPRGGADMLLAMEPVEALRYVDYLKKDGKIIAAENPFVNIPNYPDLEELKNQFNNFGQAALLEAESLAKESGNSKAKNMVLVGAASTILPISIETLKGAIEKLFKPKGDDIVQKNYKAFDLGRADCEATFGCVD